MNSRNDTRQAKSHEYACSGIQIDKLKMQCYGQEHVIIYTHLTGRNCGVENLSHSDVTIEKNPNIVTTVK